MRTTPVRRSAAISHHLAPARNIAQADPQHSALSTQHRHRLKDGAILLVFLGLTALFFWRPIFTGQPLSAADILYQSPPWLAQRDTVPGLAGGVLWNRLMSDNVYGYYPEEIVATRFLKQGILPLWDPYVFSGTPLVGESQRGVFYPPNLALRLLPGDWTFSYGVILHFFLAACFMYALLRQVGLDRGPAALGGLVFEFSGWMIAWVLTPYGIYTVVWLPLMVLCYDRALRLWRSSHRRRGSVGWAVAAGIVIALQVLAGQIQFVSYNLIALGLYGAIQVVRAAGRWPTASALAPVWLGGLAVVTGLLLASIQLLPTLELLGVTGRAVRPFDQMLAHDLMPFSHLLTALVPYFYGSFLDDHYSGWLNTLETTFYFGLAPLALAGIALVRQRGSTVFFFALVGLLPLLVLLCPAVFSLFYLTVPGFQQTFPSRMLYLVPFGFAGLAAFGAAALLRAVRQGCRWPAWVGRGLLLTWFALAIAALTAPLLTTVRPATIARFGWEINLPYDAYQMGQVGWALALLGLLAAVAYVIGRRIVPTRYGAGLLIGVFVLDAFSFGVNYNPAFPADLLYPVTPAIAFLQDQTGKFRIAAGDGSILPPNVSEAYGLEDVRGYTSLYSGRYQTLVAATQGQLPVFPPLEDGRPNQNQLLAIARTDHPLLWALNPRFVLQLESDLPERSIRRWAQSITLDSPIEDAYRPGIRTTERAWERILHAHPPFTMTYQIGQLPPDPVQLRVGFGMDTRAWSQSQDGVLFEVLAQRPGQAPQVLLSRHLDPKANPDDRAWVTEQVSLAEFAGQPVTITLRSSAGPADDAWYDWALWGDPQIIVGRPLLADLTGDGAPDASASGGRLPTSRLTIDGVTHEALLLRSSEFLVPSSESEYPGLETRNSELETPVRVPEHGRLTFAAAALGPNFEWAERAGDLAITIDGAVVFKQRFEPSQRPDHRHWSQVSIDLSAWAGRTVQLGLRLTAPPDVQVAIGDPRLLDARLDPGLDLVFNREIAIFQHAKAVERAYLVAQAQSVETPADALAAAQAPGFDPRTTVILEGAADAPQPSGAPGRAEILSYGPNEVSVLTRADSTNYLVLADQYYPGWRAYLDGEEVPIYPANYIVRAVAVPPGEHTVRFVYAPRALMVGALVSGLTALLIGAAFAWRWRRAARVRR